MILDPNIAVSEEELYRIFDIADDFPYWAHIQAQGPEIEIIFTDDSYLYPKVKFLTGGTYLILIPKDLLRYIYDSFTILLSNPTVLEGTGTTSHVLKIKTLTNITSYSNFTAQFTSENRPDFDQERVALHLQMYRTAVSSLIFHELCHIYNGHLGYLNSKGGEKNLSVIDLKTLEMDAESCAISMVINAYRLTNAPDIYGLMENKFTEDGILICIATALTWVTNIFPGKLLNYIELEKIPHIPFAERYQIVLGVIDKFVEVNNLKVDSKFACEYARGIVGNVLIAQVETFQDHRQRTGEIFPDPNSLELPDGYKTMLSNWNNLRHLLLPFAYCELPSEFNESN